jgi:hypothetical protein
VQWLAALWLVLTTAAGTATIELRPRLVIEHRRVAPRPPATLPARVAPGWIIVDGPSATAASARRVGPTFQAEVELAWRAEEPGIELAVTITYLEPVRVVREALELTLPAAGVRAVHRDGELREAPRAGSLRLDRWTPRLCEVRHGGASLLVDGAAVDGMEVRRAGGAVTVTLELDDAREHPFRVEPRCRTRWRGGGRPLDESARLRQAGERVTYRARLVPGAVPLVTQRLPAGRRAAVVFSDHADQTTLGTLRALLYGTSDEHDPRFGRGGFVGHGLPLTKAFFRRGEPERPQLDDPRVLALAAKLVAAGGEIALHSATPEPDARPVTAEALAVLKPLKVETWIDHQPPTNCEAYTDRGWRPGDPYYIGDLLAGAGVRYVWAAGKEPKDDINLLRPRELGARTPFLYPQAAPASQAATGLWLFRSVWAYVDARRFLELLAPARLDRLEAERGVAILHTYLEAMRSERRLRHRNLMQPGATPAVVAIDPRLDGVLADLARRAAAGRLWVTTVRGLGDHLRAAFGLALRYLPDGAAAIHNPGPAAARGVTIGVPLPGARLALRGASGVTVQPGPDGPTAWFDLAPGATARLAAQDAHGHALPLVAPVAVRFSASRPGPARAPTPPPTPAPPRPAPP